MTGRLMSEVVRLREDLARCATERDIALAAYGAIREGYVDTERESELRQRAERAETERDLLKGLLCEWWESSKLSTGNGDFERWLAGYTPRVRDALADEPREP